MGIEVPLATTVLRYFSPATSPFYIVGVSGIIALTKSCNTDVAHWKEVAGPIYGVLILSLMLALFAPSLQTAVSDPEHPESRKPLDDREEQLKVSRSVAISGALLALVFAAINLDKAHFSMQFWLSYVICIVQLLVFLIYSWARSKKEEDDFNFVQVALITTALLSGAVYNLIEFSKYYNPDAPRQSASVGRYETVAFGLYALWFVCILFWLNHLRKMRLIVVKFNRPT